MVSSTTTTTTPRAEPRRASRGFTLVELMVSTVIASFVLLAVISTFLFVGRTSVSLAQYNDMEHQARVTFQTLGPDCRVATDVTWTDANTLVLTVNGNQVTYAHDPATHTFSRTANGQTRVLVDHVEIFAYKAFNIDAGELDLSDGTVATGNSTKMIQVDLGLRQQETTTVATRQRLISSRFVLRNKGVS